MALKKKETGALNELKAAAEKDNRRGNDRKKRSFNLSPESRKKLDLMIMYYSEEKDASSIVEDAINSLYDEVKSKIVEEFNDIIKL